MPPIWGLQGPSFGAIFAFQLRHSSKIEGFFKAKKRGLEHPKKTQKTSQKLNLRGHFGPLPERFT